MTDPYVQEMLRLKRKSKKDDATIIELRRLVHNQRDVITQMYKDFRKGKRYGA